MSPRAAIHYVDQHSSNPVVPYTNWATAASAIQQAVDVSQAGDEVLVTNGVYASGGRAIFGAMTNRVAIDRPVVLRSVNGPGETIIAGYQVPGLTVGDGAVRCVYLTNGASLNGFTLTNGGTRSAGDEYREQSGAGAWLEPGANLGNCIIVRNVATTCGGGTFGAGTLNNCAVFMNSAQTGGGSSCAINQGLRCVLNNCTVTGNAADNRGGVFQGQLNNCIVYFNRARSWPNHDAPNSVFQYSCTTPLPSEGRGNLETDPRLASLTHLGTNSPCLAAGELALTTGTDIDGEPWDSPPAMGCDQYHPGAAIGPLTTSIIAGATNASTEFKVAFTAAIGGATTMSLWDFGDGTLATNQPYTTHAWQVSGDYQLTLTAYNDAYPGGIAATQVMHIVSPPVHYVSAETTNPIPPYDSWATAARTIQDAIEAASVPGALVLVTNGIYAVGGKTVSGGMTNRVAADKPLNIISVNGAKVTVIQGYQVQRTTNGEAAVRCAYLADNSSLKGFILTGGATRTNESGGGALCESTNVMISECVFSGNASAGGGGGVCLGTVSNCTFSGNWAVYPGGGAYQSLLLHSELTGNSAGWGGGCSFSTLLDCHLWSNRANAGAGAVYSVLDACRLETNFAGGAGAVHSCTLTNCLLTGNFATNGGGASVAGTLSSCTLSFNTSGWSGGGAASGLLQNCVLLGNSADREGGGAYGATLFNCTVVGNSAGLQGGGAFDCYLYNSILYFNSAGVYANHYSWSQPYACCTTPDPGGMDNITNAPLFVDIGAGDLRLQNNSPCINAGNNAFVQSLTDRDGNPRIVSATVDIGAYEFQGSGSTISYAWLQYYGLPTDGTADVADPDGDSMVNWQEWRCSTDPTNGLSALRLLSAAKTDSGVTVQWQSVSNRTYFVMRAGDPLSESGFHTVSTNLQGLTGTTDYIDSTAVGDGPFFYRVGVE